MIEDGAHGVHLRIEVVEMMQQEGFGKKRDLWRAEFQLAVVTDDHVLDENAELWRKIGEAFELICKEAHSEHDMTEQLSVTAVTEASIVGQFFDFADVMENDAGD